jgi:WD repeat-containing protein 7
VGCEDGSLYLFHAHRTQERAPSVDTSSRKRDSNPLSSATSSLSPTPRHVRRGFRSPRSLSPASGRSPTFSPFQVTKSTVVSSVSAEQVEAPKNYVDFEDEQEKLKGMIKKKSGVKDWTMVDSLLPGGDKLKPHGPDKCEDNATSGELAASDKHEWKKELRVSTSAAMSSASSVRSVSTPSTPISLPTLRIGETLRTSHWSLLSHTIPCSSGLSGPVVSLKLVTGYHVAAALFQTGYVPVSAPYHNSP